jgi:predicted RNA-binding protein YlqC (UPF0109 family)
MKDLLSYILKEITKNESIEVKEEVENNFSRLTILAPKDLMGIIIGKEGRTIKAIRNLLKVRATLEKKGVNVTVEEKA